MKNLLSVHDLSAGVIENLLDRAETLRKDVVIPNKSLDTLRNVLITHLFSSLVRARSILFRLPECAWGLWF